MEQRILEFMRENGIAVLGAWRTIWAASDSTRSQFPFQVFGQGDTGCLLSWLDGGKAVALFFDCKLAGAAFTKWVRELDQKVRQMYQPEQEK